MARISTRQLAGFCRRLGTSLRAGLDLRQILAQESRTGPPAKRREVDVLNQRIGAGDTFSDAIKDNGYFPLLVRELAPVGEESGRMDAVFLELATYYDHVLSLRRQFLLGIAWPTIQLVMGIFIVGLLIWIIGVISPENALPISGNAGALIYFVLVTLFFVSLTLIILAIVRGWLGSLPMQVAMWVPVVGGCLRTMALARLAWSLCTALDAGVDARRSMRLALQSTNNPYYTAHLEQVDMAIMNGREFNEALMTTGAFPSEFLDSLAAAELSGTHTESLEYLAESYRQRAETTSKLLTYAASFAIWGLIGVIMIAAVFYLFFALYLGPIYEALDEASPGWR